VRTCLLTGARRQLIGSGSTEDIHRMHELRNKKRLMLQ